MLTEKERLCGVMANTGFGDTVWFQSVVGNILIKASIPSRARKKNGEIKRTVYKLLKTPCEKSKMTLRAIHGVIVEYITAAELPSHEMAATAA